MNNTPTRVASGDEAAKATWDRMVATLPPIDAGLLLGRLDEADGVGTRMTVHTDFPRLRVEDGAPAPVSASTVKQSLASIVPESVEPPRSKVVPFVGIIVALVGVLGLLVWHLGGAA